MLPVQKGQKHDELSNVVVAIIHEYRKHVFVTHRGCSNHAMVQLYHVPLA